MIDWMKYKWLYFALSALILVPGIVSLFLFGLKPAIDFTGGSLLELKTQQELNPKEVDQLLIERNFEVSAVQKSGENQILIRLQPIEKNQAEEIQSAINEKFNQESEEIRFETVGPTLGKELVRKTIWAIILAAGFILTYVAWRFKDLKFGVCAILAMFHDTFILLGSFSLLGHFLGVEIDTLFVTAMLTILSFSVHDTIVVYDRIRESQKLLPRTPFREIINKAVTETLSRSVNNSMTIIFMLIALLLLGGTTIRWFVAALLIGTISGTYSSTFTAAPLLIIWEKFAKRK
ncbi:protein-export membrane protein SecF [Microgenomates group bacterium RBG_19FT_COMBO_39_10]|nr:MAG: protein-export membrane protein SecF [Microgenomates group bacterium RBG_19FT_COMBO_39_10]